jgi:hypothetical protein
MEAVRSSETLVTTYKTTRRHDTEDCHWRISSSLSQEFQKYSVVTANDTVGIFIIKTVLHASVSEKTLTIYDNFKEDSACIPQGHLFYERRSTLISL